ncbi:MAG: penicillin-binding protein 2, partial [Planctomycetota bacterium]|nr:penicillin-binding protein 2 [Planctomycetota bacterium]
MAAGAGISEKPGKPGKTSLGKGPRARGALLFGVLTTLMFLGVAARLVQLQVFEYESHTREIASTIIKPSSERDRRGRIIDSRGVVLAASVPVRACAMDPQLIEDAARAALPKDVRDILSKGEGPGFEEAEKTLADAVAIQQEKIIGRLTEALALTSDEVAAVTRRVGMRYVPKNSAAGKPVPYRFIWVQRRVADERYLDLADRMARAGKDAADAWRNRRRWVRLAAQMRTARETEKESYCRDAAEGWRRHALEAEGRYAGVFFPPEFERFYPQGQLAAHVVGYANIDGDGMGGIESSYNSKLTGTPVRRLVARDARSRPLMSLVSDERTADGMTVELTVDSVVQAIVEEELRNTVEELKVRSPDINAHAVVMDPYTGDILAMANYPTFDPNHPGVHSETGERVTHRERRNDAVSAIQEPGSTFKPLMVCASLEEGVASLEEDVECSTLLMNNGRRSIKDLYPYGRMTLEMAVVKSSNPGMVRTGLKLGPEKMREYVLKFGFGEKSGRGLAGESRGMVTSKEKWNDWTMGSVPMGYEVGVTTLQMAAAYSVIANGGLLPTPNIVKAVYDGNGGLIEEREVVMRRRVVSADTAEKMRAVMRKVVTTGTGRRANSPEYELGGKTGTANMTVSEEERAKGMKG